jgi:hypothetical protein
VPSPPPISACRAGFRTEMRCGTACAGPWRGATEIKGMSARRPSSGRSVCSYRRPLRRVARVSAHELEPSALGSCLRCRARWGTRRAGRGCARTRGAETTRGNLRVSSGVSSPFRRGAHLTFVPAPQVDITLTV